MIGGKIIFLAISLASVPAGATRQATADASPDATAFSTPPLPADDDTWAGAAAIIIAGLFVAAAAVGAIVQIHRPQDPSSPG